MNQHSVLMAALVAASAMLAQASSAQTPPDNTKTNKMESSDRSRTAEGQSNSRSDLETTRQIRKSLVGDGSLSTYAHNVKIITLNGKVTLNGVVRNEQEKAAVVAKAAQIAGQAQVVDALKVAPSEQ